jgi:Na+/H+-translocating membrane pyrophosphatase
MLTSAVLPISLGILGLVAALMVYARILQTPAGEGRVKEISDEIHLGAMVFMASEYKRLAIFCLICIAALYWGLGVDTAISFTLGAFCSGVAGYIGMYSATKANVRTAVAANTEGAAAALNVLLQWACSASAYFTTSWVALHMVLRPLRALRWVAHPLLCSAVLVVASLPNQLTSGPTLLARLRLAFQRMTPATLP